MSLISSSFLQYLILEQKLMEQNKCQKKFSRDTGEMVLDFFIFQMHILLPVSNAELQSPVPYNTD